VGYPSKRGSISKLPESRRYRYSVRVPFIQVPGTRSRLPGVEYLEPDTRYLSRSDAEDRIPSTEPGTGKRAHRDCLTA